MSRQRRALPVDGGLQQYSAIHVFDILRDDLFTAQPNLFSPALPPGIEGIMQQRKASDVLC